MRTAVPTSSRSRTLPGKGPHTVLAMLALLAVVWVVSQEVWAGEVTSNAGFRAALNSITRSELQEHVALLADDALEGREAGTPGGQAAGDFLAEQCAELDLFPAGNGGYFQPFGEDYRNVLALLPGSDPARRKEVIVVSAHYDHVGYGRENNSREEPGEIHNGADDNASGTAAVLELAEAMTLLPEPPSRSILFAFWDAEEKGLLGSKHWTTESPLLPLPSIKLNVNLDMVGRMRDEKLYVYGTRTSFGMRSLLSEANRQTNLELIFSWQYRRDSDQYAFAAQDIPALLFHTGKHADYHTPGDDAEKIETAEMERLSRFIFTAVCELAELPELPGFRRMGEEESEDTLKSLVDRRARWRNRLGVRCIDDGNEGVLIDGVEAESPAEKAGLQSGDRIRRLGEWPVHVLDDLIAASLLAPQATTIAFQRGDEPLQTVDVELRGDPTRLGIQWAEDDAEPHAALVTAVLPHSPAARLGIEPGDYVLAVGDTRLTSPDELPELIEQTTPLVITWEHNGRRRTAEVPPPSLPDPSTAAVFPPVNAFASRGHPQLAGLLPPLVADSGCRRFETPEMVLSRSRWDAMDSHACY